MSERELKPDAENKFNIKDLSHRRVQDFHSIYANTAGFAVGFYDFEIIFGRIVSGHSKDENIHPYIEDVTGVTMSWEHAKALASGLSKVIESYEVEQGKIREPK
ncbi:MAG: DUF3467 domain-containing protein [Candidatus Solibacter sp.]|jgi:hypothetical protein